MKLNAPGKNEKLLVSAQFVDEIRMILNNLFLFKYMECLNFIRHIGFEAFVFGGDLEILVISH